MSEVEVPTQWVADLIAQGLARYELDGTWIQYQGVKTLIAKYLRKIVQDDDAPWELWWLAHEADKLDPPEVGK